MSIIKTTNNPNIITKYQSKQQLNNIFVKEREKLFILEFPMPPLSKKKEIV